MADLPALHQKTLSLQVIETIRKAIVEGPLKPGDPLRESEIAAQMRVSRAPVREALLLLEEEGLVERVPYQGTFVSRLSRRDVEELYSLRAVYEGFALDLVLQHETAPLLASLRELVAQMQQLADHGESAAVNRLDLQFHDRLVAQADHRRLYANWRGLVPHISRVMALGNLTNEDLHTIVANHQPIIQAIHARDLAMARAVVCTHIADSGRRALARWEDRYGV